MEPILEIKNLSHSYHSLEGETPALLDISFSVPRGKFLSIVGPSGCGKSTLLSLISGLMKPAENTLFFHGNSIGYMLQKDHLLEWRTIYRNVILGLEIQHKLTSENIQKAHKYLEQYGLGDFKNSKPSELSGGMRQRAALIRTLLLEPDLLLLDEPFSALDYQTRLLVSDDIGQIIRSEKRSAILVTHDLSEAISLGDIILVLTHRPGKVKAFFPLSFDLEKDTPLNRRNSAEFKQYFNLIWKEVNEHE